MRILPHSIASDKFSIINLYLYADFSRDFNLVVLLNNSADTRNQDELKSIQDFSGGGVKFFDVFKSIYGHVHRIITCAVLGNKSNLIPVFLLHIESASYFIIRNILIIYTARV